MSFCKKSKLYNKTTMEFPPRPSTDWLVRQTNEKDKTCWLRSAVAELDASSVATLRKSYADMFECEKPQWKINMEKYIANLREREESGKDKGDA